MNFLEKLKKWQTLINQRLDQYLPAISLQPVQLHQAMHHSMNAGGKRLRPILALAAHEMFPSQLDPVPAAIALECIHTYSLIHDDLPAMDDSDLRRGVPSCHKAFDEATAILAGDAFQPLAFEILAQYYRDDPQLGIDLISMLSQTAGSQKLVGGQMQDLLSEGNEPDEGNLSYIHSNKTAAMIEVSLQMGFRIGSEGENSEKLAQIGKVGRSLGLAFQAVDDLLDVTQTTTQLGKDARHDGKSGKITWVSLKGESEARRLAAQHTEDARQSLLLIGGNSVFLSELMNYMLNREF
jgi:geranylgeranyl pyrophosphate synthase